MKILKEGYHKMSHSILIIGAGAAGSVVAQKCAQMAQFGEIHLASRRIISCEKVQKQCDKSIHIYELDANIADDVAALIERTQAKLVINMALPYQDLSIMAGCLKAKAHYMDTANYEPEDEAKFEYSWQWNLHEDFKAAGLTAILGCGFDPGVTNAYCQYANTHFFDEIQTIDIVDCNDGDHHQFFATNFNPEINIREITQPGRYYENGEWITIPSMSQSKDIDFPGVGVRKGYCLFHEEMESLVKHIPSIQRIRFWMTFSDHYLSVLNTLEALNLTKIEPVDYEGTPIVPLKFLKSILPTPSSLGSNYQGRTSIGCIITGVKDGKQLTKFIYNNTSHEDAFREFSSQAVSYTTGVPAALGASLIVDGTWQKPGVFNIEQCDVDPFMELLNNNGLAWHCLDLDMGLM